MPLAAEPPAEASLFGDQLPLAVRYADWLTSEGVRRGLVGPREAERIWPRHLINCAVLATLIPPEARVVDLGSGAGLPGIALAVARPDLRIVLVESLLRRTTFLAEVVADLGLAGVTVRRARAEELTGAGLDADVVTARAIAPIARLCRWAGPLLSAQGCLLAIKGDAVMDELSSGWRSIRSAGFTGDVDLLALGLDTSGDPRDDDAAWRKVSVDVLAHWPGGETVLPADPQAAAVVDIGENADRAALVLRLYRRSSSGRDPDDQRCGLGWRARGCQAGR